MLIPQGKRVLALDIGGSAVKAALFEDAELKKTGFWSHSYNEGGPEAALDHLTRESAAFCDGNVDTVGLAVAGLIATDESLFRSTVLGAFEDQKIGRVLAEAMGAPVATIDNDADCGAMGEHFFASHYFADHPLFYAVIGSGVGSNYANADGSVRYLVRIDRSKPYNDEMNHTLSDIGLKIRFPRETLYKIFHEYEVESRTVDQVLSSEFSNGHRGLDGEDQEVRSGRLGSAVGVRNVLEILWKGNFYKDETRRYYMDRIKGEEWERKCSMDDLYDRRRAAKVIASLARSGEPLAKNAYHLMGVFLGRILFEAQHLLYRDLKSYQHVHMAGPIMAAGDLFLNEVHETMRDNGVTCNCVYSHAFTQGQNPNLWGAYICAGKAAR